MFFDAIAAYNAAFRTVFSAIYGVQPDTEAGFWMAMATLFAGNFMVIVGVKMLEHVRKMEV